MSYGSSCHITCVILGSNKMQNGDILVPAYLGRLGKVQLDECCVIVVYSVVDLLFQNEVVTWSLKCIQEHACSLPAEDRDDDFAMARAPSGPAGRRGGVSAEVYREEDAACYVKRVKLPTLLLFLSIISLSLSLSLSLSAYYIYL